MNIKRLNTHIKIKFTTRFNLGCFKKILFSLAIFFFLNSCEDSGCIEADDFGEYISKGVRVYANASNQLCKYNSNIDVGSPNQPVFLKACVDIERCATMATEGERKTCARKCEINCQNIPSKQKEYYDRSGFSVPAGKNPSETKWIEVGDDNFKISSKSKILVSAFGNVELGEKSNDQIIMDKADFSDLINNSIQQKTKLFKVGSNEELKLKISGIFEIDTERLNTPSYTKYFEDPSYSASEISLKNNELLTSFPGIINGSKRVFGYFIPTIPINFDDMNYVPILPDPTISYCILEAPESVIGLSGTPRNQHTKTKCSSDDTTYPDNYADSVNLPAKYIEADRKKFNQDISSNFDFNNDKNQENIKYNDSGFLLKYNEKPHSSNKPIPSNSDTLNSILKDITREFNSYQILPISMPNQYEDYDVRLVLTQNSGTNCLNYYNDNTKIPKFKIIPITQNNPSDSSDFIRMSKEASTGLFQVNQKLLYTPIRVKSREKLYIEKVENDKDANDQMIPDNCSFELHFYKYLSVENLISGFTKIGLVKNFKLEDGETYRLEGNSFPNMSDCAMNIDIKNPDGSYEFTETKRYEINTAEENGIYLRKGQVLLIKPNIWDKHYNIIGSDSISRLVNKEILCGVGFYIKKIPKPAVLCHRSKTQKVNVNEDYVDTNNCSSLLLKDNIVQGCSIDYSECDSYKKLNPITKNLEINNKFCPSSLCLPTEEDFKTTSCIPKYDPTTKQYSSPSNSDCPEFTAITKFADQTETIAGEERFKSNYAKINIKCDKLINCTSPFCKEFNDLIRKNTLYTQEYNALSIADKESYLTFDKCKNCLTSNIAKLKKTFASLDSTSMDLCYDLENYKGSMNDFYNLSEATVDRMEVKDLANKGLKYLPQFLNLYGNFYPLKFLEENFGTFSRKIYEVKGNIYSSSNGFIKFTLITTPNDRNKLSGDFATNTPSNFNINLINTLFFNVNQISITDSIDKNSKYIKDGSRLMISSTSKSEFKNGQRLSIVPCKDNNSSTCSSFEQSSALIATINNDFPKVISYQEAGEDAGNIYNDNNYSFNEFGYLTRIKDPTSHSNAITDFYECSNPNRAFVGANFLCLDYKDSSNTSRISLKIIDNETSKCNRTNGNDCQPTEIGCDGVKKININWDGKSTGNCEEEASSCNKKFYCTNKYFNNSGYYDVGIRILSPEKTQIAKLANSIITPVMEEIDGYKIDKDENVALFSGVENIYKRYENNVVSVDNTINLSLDSGAFDGSQDSNIIAYKKYKFFSESSKFNVVIPEKKDDKCNTKKGCVISYIGAFIGDIGDDGMVITSDCFSSTPNLRSEIRTNCLKKLSCNFTIGINSVNTNILSGTELISRPDFCNKPLYIYVAYKEATKDLTKESQSERMYKRITGFKVFQTTVTLSMVLMITFYGLGFMMGVTEMKQSDIIDRLIKIGLIYLFTSPIYGWLFFEKFFVTFFKGGTDYLTFLMASIFADDNSINEALSKGNFSDRSPLFASVDKVLGLYLINDVVHKKIAALLFYNFIGIIYCVILYYCAITYIYAASNAILLYLTAQFFTSVLFIIGPFFFIFILFKQTKGFFDNWLNSLIGFSLQQIFVIFTLNIFNMLIYMATKMALSFRICWDNIWYLNSFGFTMSLFSFWTIQDAPPYINETTKISVNGELKNTSPSLTMIILTWSMVTIMRSFLNTISDLAATLSGGIQASALGTNISQGASQALSKASALGSKVFDKAGGNKMISRLDKAAFDSGALAKKARKEKKQQNKNDRKDIADMKKAGDDAVKDYKMNNAQEFANMSESEKKAKLMEVKKNAMISNAESKGKSPEEINRLMNLKGYKGNGGSNIFGAGINLYRSRNNLSTSLSDSISAVDTRFSNDEIKGAMKNMDEDQRKGFVDNLKSGKIQKQDNSNRSLNPINNPTLKERETAIKQLEDSGKIAKKTNLANSSSIQAGLRMIGGESKRSDKDEKLIQEQMQKNAINSSTDKTSNFTEKEIDKYEKLAKYHDAKDIGDKDAMKSARKEFKEADRAVKISNSKDKIFSNNNIDNIRKEEIKANNEKDLKENQIQQNNIGNKINETQDSIKQDPVHNEMDKLNNKIKSGEASDEDKSKFNKMVIEDNKNSRNTGKVSYKEKDSIRSNLQENLSELKNNESNIKNRNK